MWRLQVIGEPTETNQREQLVSVIALFCFHQFLATQARARSMALKYNYLQIYDLLVRTSTTLPKLEQRHHNTRSKNTHKAMTSLSSACKYSRISYDKYKAFEIVSYK